MIHNKEKRDEVAEELIRIIKHDIDTTRARAYLALEIGHERARAAASPIATRERRDNL